MGRHERMKRGSGMKDRDERSRGIEIRIADAFGIIKPTVPFKLVKHYYFDYYYYLKHEGLRKRN